MVKWYLLPHKIQLKELFISETDLNAVVPHNLHEDNARAQEGGTEIFAVDTISGWVSESGTNRMGMGR